MIVYRFEKNGIGPYVSKANGYFVKSERSIKVMSALRRQYKQSETDEQMKNYVKAHGSKQYMYGCKEKKALRAYFGPSFKRLFSQGYRIKRYTVPDSEILDAGIEVAFPVKYHKLRSQRGIKKTIKKMGVKI